MSVIEINSARRKPAAQATPAQPTENKPKRAHHTTPRTLMPCEAARIVDELQAGRAAYDVARTYSTTTAVVLELWLRRVERLYLRRVA